MGVGEIWFLQELVRSIPRARGVRRGTYINSHFLFSLLATSLARDDNQFILVLLQPLDIQFQALVAQIASPVIHCNAQFPRLLDVEARLLELFKGESSALADFDVVSQAGTADRGTQQGRWLGSETASTRFTGCSTTFFACWLIEPGPDSTLPILRYQHHCCQIRSSLATEREMSECAYLSEMVVGQLLIPVQSHDSMESHLSKLTVGEICVVRSPS